MGSCLLSGAALVCLGLAVLSGPTHARVGGRSPCSPVETRIDPALADTFVVFDQGRGMGQVLQVSDTLVSSVTFWITQRYDSVYASGYLFITEVDSTALSPYLPNVSYGLLYGSPLVTAPSGDGVHPRPFTINIDPPFALPKPGEYFFVLSEGTCFGPIELRATHSNPYLRGRLWKTGTSFCDGRAPGTPMVYADSTFDLCIDVV